MDSIYKLMNKINDQDSLTEKYNVKDEKDLVTLHESLRKPLNEGINLYTTHGTLVLEQSKASRIPLNSYVSLVNLNRDAMDVLKIKIDSKVKPSQLLGIVVGAYKPTPDHVRDYALLLGLLTGKKFSDSAASSDTIYKIRVPEPFKATQNKDREMLLPRWLVSEIDEQAYIDAMNRLFPRKGLDKLVHGKDKKFNAVDGGGRAYFDKKLKNKKNEAFYDNESLNKKHNVRTLKDVSRLTESVNNITEDQLRAVFATWNDTVGYGFITLGTNAVRYTSEELDLQQYVKMSDLVNAVNADEELTLESISEDPMILTDYFTDTCGVSHYFEIEEFIETSTELNIKYFGVEIVDEVDTDLRSAAESSYDEFDESVLNVRTLKDVKKLQESSNKYTSEDAVDFAREYILDNNNWNDHDVELDGDKLSVTIWTEDEYGDEVERIFRMRVSKLLELVEDEDAFASYIDDSTEYESVGDDFYERAQEEINKHFNCTGAFLEPSTQMGRGRTFLFADDMSFEGSFDFETGEEYIHDNDFDGFLQLVLNSFKPVVDENLEHNI